MWHSVMSVRLVFAISVTSYYNKILTIYVSYVTFLCFNLHNFIILLNFAGLCKQ